MAGPKVTALLDGQRPDGSFGKELTIRRYAGTSRAPEDMVGVDHIDVQQDVGGTLWRTLAMTELAVPADEPVLSSADFLLDAAVSAKPPRVIDGLPRLYGFLPGGVLLIAAKIGLAGDARARTIAEQLIAWQWPDGGWNCHLKASGRRSSFHQ